MALLREAQRCIANQLTHRDLNAFIRLADEGLVTRSVESDPTDRPLHGKLVAIKDNICTSDLPTTAASTSLTDFVSPFDASAVSILRGAGAVIAGKTNLDEFGMGSHSTFSHFGPVKQQTSNSEPAISAGGSSGGSALAVATEQCWAALGTDTGGSVRLPAAYTGTVGFKPSYGRISRWGVIAYANSLDTVGVIGRDTRDVRKVFDYINRFDPSDPTCLSEKTREQIRQATANVQVPNGLRIGVPAEYNVAELAPSVRDAWRHTLRLLSRQGHSIHPVSLPTTRHALSAYYVLAPAEASSNLAKYDGVRYGYRKTLESSAAGAESDDATPHTLFANTRGAGFGAEVRRRILLGSYSLSADAIDNYFIQAQRVRRMVQQDFNRAFRQPNVLVEGSRALGPPDESHQDGVDVLLCPTAPTTAPTLESLRDVEPVRAYMNDVFTVPASLAGLPATSVPVTSRTAESGQSMPNIGMQVIGQFGFDNLVLDVAGLIEASTKEDSS